VWGSKIRHPTRPQVHKSGLPLLELLVQLTFATSNIGAGGMKSRRAVSNVVLFSNSAGYELRGKPENLHRGLSGVLLTVEKGGESTAKASTATPSVQSSRRLADC